MKRVASAAIIAMLTVLPAGFRCAGQEIKSADPGAHAGKISQVVTIEEVHLHIDRAKYIAGEDIWFSVYATDREKGMLSAGSAVAYVEVLNPWNRPVVQKRLHLSGGRGGGNFLLPDSVSSGTYTIRAYTNQMKNFLPDNCYMYEIDIYNPFRDLYFWRRSDSAEVSGRGLISPPGEKESNIIILSDSVFGRREKVTLKIGRGRNIKSSQPGIEMSISVTPSELVFMNLGRFNPVTSAMGPQQYGMESNGHFLSGRIIYRNTDAADSSDFLYMSVQGKIAEFQYAPVDNSGRFTFVLPLEYNLRNLILQPENANNNMSLEIEPPFSRKLYETKSYRDGFTQIQLDLFSRLSFNYQTAKIYGTTLKKLTGPANGIPKPRRFYGIPEMEIFLDDYISLPVMQEVFFELLPGILLRNGKSGYEIKITNPMTGNFYEEPPLVMIDGVIINDLTVLADLDPETVEKIEVVKTPYLVGDLILHGIVNVITRSGDFSDTNRPDYAVVLPYRTVDESFTFTAPDYSDEQVKTNRKPDLRNTLYWDPSVATDVNGEAMIEFWTSDLPGIYTISVQGTIGEGMNFSVQKAFTVR